MRKAVKSSIYFFDWEEMEVRREGGGGGLLEVGRLRTPEQEASGKRQSCGWWNRWQRQRAAVSGEDTQPHKNRSTDEHVHAARRAGVHHSWCSSPWTISRNLLRRSLDCFLFELNLFSLGDSLAFSLLCPSLTRSLSLSLSLLLCLPLSLSFSLSLQRWMEGFIS